MNSGKDSIGKGQGKQMKAVIFGGTTEGRELSLALAEAGADVVVSVASEYGSEEQGQADGVAVVEGLKDASQIRELIHGCDMVIDATHPYAVVVTENVRLAAAAEGLELLRLIRERSELPAENGNVPLSAEGRKDAVPAAEDEAVIHVAADAEAAAQLARSIAGADGRVLLTTGSKELAKYSAVFEPENLYPRVLPVVSSIEACETAGIPHRNIIAIQGPFSQALNEAVLRDYEINVMITKESGRAGGFLEKIRACETCGVPAVVIARPREDGMSFEEVLAVCREKTEREKIRREEENR